MAMHLIVCLCQRVLEWIDYIRLAQEYVTYMMMSPLTCWFVSILSKFETDPFSRLLRHTCGCGGSTLRPIQLN